MARADDLLVGTPDDVIRCARPMLFEIDDEQFRYSGLGSAFIAVRDHTWMLVTASHVVKGAHPRSVRVLPTDRSSRWLELTKRVYARSALPGDPDVADLECFTINLSDLQMPHTDSLAGVDLGFPPATPGRGDELRVTGYPTDGRGVDYNARCITAIGRGVRGAYIGQSFGARCHEMELTDLGDVTDFDGFSGSPVYWIGDQNGDLVSMRLAGVVLRGSATSRRAHYVETSVLLALAETAVTGHDTYLIRPASKRARPA